MGIEKIVKYTIRVKCNCGSEYNIRQDILSMERTVGVGYTFKEPYVCPDCNKNYIISHTNTSDNKIKVEIKEGNLFSEKYKE